MDRLTIVTADGDICFDVPDDPEGAYDITDLAKWEHFDVLNSIAERLKEYEDKGLTPAEIKVQKVLFTVYSEELKKFKAVGNSIKNLKIGDVLYCVQTINQCICTATVIMIFLNANGWWVEIDAEDGVKRIYELDRVGRLMFTVKSDAEKVLDSLHNDDVKDGEILDA